MLFQYKYRQIDNETIESPEINQHHIMSLDFDKETKTIQWEQSLFNNDGGAIGQLHTKKEKRKPEKPDPDLQ